ncbi:hypothetical protein Hanom_Chr16g01480461 [Helianthus anomalus]
MPYQQLFLIYIYNYTKNKHTYLYLNGPLSNRHVTLLPRPTPGLKPKPQGPRPTPKPTRGGDLGVLPQPTLKLPPHTPRPKCEGPIIS